MKKLLVLATLLLVLVFAVVACTDEQTEDPTNDNGTTVTEDPTTEEVTSGDEEPTTGGDEEPTTGGDEEPTTDNGDEEPTTGGDEEPTTDNGEDQPTEGGDLTVDFSAIENELRKPFVEGAGFPTDKDVLWMQESGANFNLGEIDLSKYSSVIITYGSDGAAKLGDDGSELVLTKNGAVQNEDKTANEEAEIIASGVLSNATGAWGNATRTVEIALNTDYSGAVYLSMNMKPRATDATAFDGIVVSEVVFVAKEVAEPVKYEAEKDLTEEQKADKALNLYEETTQNDILYTFGKIVGDNTLAISAVDGGVGGKASVEILYCTAPSRLMKLEIYVNDSETAAVTLESDNTANGNWFGNIINETVELDLVAGENTITFKTYAPDGASGDDIAFIDYVEVTPAA